ncbi:MAG: site-specific integrase [Bacteroidales bacterium]|nr:site-specific integrase [Bacteroidales bacterium]
MEAVQAELVRLGLTRKEVNRRVKLARKVFRWGVRQGMVPPDVAAVLAEVEMLRPGQTTAPDRPPIRPVDPAAVESTLPYLLPPLRAVVQLFRLTGARPSEILNVRPHDIERANDVWILRQPKHKTAWKIGRARVVYLGPDAQRILTPWLEGVELDSFVFSPVRAVEEQHRSRSAKRTTPRYPSHMRRNTTKRKAAKQRQPGKCYTGHALTVAVRRACDRAFPPPEELAKRPDETNRQWKARLSADQQMKLNRWQQAHRWTPYQLRHLRAVELRVRYGLEHVRAVLGHTALAMSQHYSEEADRALATKAARELG